ncbi:MAG: adenosylcobinamide-phosphate synthase CbiB [Nitrospirota bacterium]
MQNIFLVVSSYIADLIFGDPERFPHPVRWMGKLIIFLENKLRGDRSRLVERIKGMIMTLIVVGTSGILTYLFLYFSKKLSPFLGDLAWIYAGYTTLSIRDLRSKGIEILEELKNNSITEARKRLSRIVGRDTEGLSEEKIVMATVESIAENTNDGIIAPLFYLFIGGPVLAVTYKAINTLDSMIGYKDKRYLHFGWFSAKLDDIANFIPARITGFLIVLSAFILRKDFRSSFKIMLRDGRKHPSPNSGISEAAMAGAIRIRLGGTATYKGVLSKKSYLGENKRLASPSLIKEALSVSFATSLLMVLSGAFLKWIIIPDY